jgi:hypothetical protein
VKKERFVVPARLDRPEILQFLFYPRREEAWQENCPDGVEELTIPVVRGVHLGGRFFFSRQGAPTILFFHGNGEIVADYTDLGQEKIDRFQEETLIIHGEEDEIIPFRDGRELYEASGASRKRLLRIPGAGHNDLLLRAGREYLRAVQELAESVAARPRTGREKAPEMG